MARGSPFIVVENKIVGMARWLPEASVLFLFRSAERLSIMIVQSKRIFIEYLGFFTKISVIIKGQYKTELTKIKIKSRNREKKLIDCLKELSQGLDLMKFYNLILPL